MKGIILAGGHGTRLHPITLATSKQLLPLYDKPLIYYPMSVLMLAEIDEILIITTPKDQSSFKQLLGDGSNFGISLTYAIQEAPKGLADAFIVGEDFIGDDSCCLILGDNLFWGDAFAELLKKAICTNQGATIFGYSVSDPHRYGIVELKNNDKILSIEEKPKDPKSNIAVTGLYIYDNDVIEIAKSIKPSARGEIEITSLNQYYLNQKRLEIELLGRGYAWLDTGTADFLLEASSFVAAIERRQGYKIACLEEIAYKNGWLEREDLIETLEKHTQSTYYDYLRKILDQN